ncbi:hypothetical protein [uncultured Campylobacter sp.]|uniref:hypothetical protein n=1 Tax=uncultured Campylobacter sp. TaxID=218934 RepID=UPI00263A0305|nr:hypothetical protein [uncultured Campylobacter sp.]
MFRFVLPAVHAVCFVLLAVRRMASVVRCLPCTVYLRYSSRGIGFFDGLACDIAAADL